jgi:hypothetical protein
VTALPVDFVAGAYIVQKHANSSGICMATAHDLLRPCGASSNSVGVHFVYNGGQHDEK